MSSRGYLKTMTCKVQRTKHRIGFGVGTTAGDLMKLLQNVPQGSTVDEVICDHDNEPEVTTIEFHEESRVE